MFRQHEYSSYSQSSLCVLQIQSDVLTGCLKYTVVYHQNVWDLTCPGFIFPESIHLARKVRYVIWGVRCGLINELPVFKTPR
jgi:hypothetical protein